MHGSLRSMRVILWMLVLPGLAAAAPFEIQVVDRATGRGVPLIELRTVHGIRCVTDSAGRVAFDEPEPVISDFFETNGGDWPVVTESEGIPLDWGVIGLPESFLISPDGEVVEKYKGGVTAAGIEQDIAENS